MTILVDYSQIVVAAFFANKLITEDSNPDESLMRHVILNTLRSNNHKFSPKYGEMIICADGKKSWRKQIFEHYKANRAKNREKSNIDWSYIFNTMTTIFQEIKELKLYTCIRVDTAEADDIIATLAEVAFRQNESCLIISTDKDMRQLQKYEGIEQYSPSKKEFLKENNPSDFLIEHIIRGDVGDGIPNVFSDDDTLVNEEKRQSPVTKKKISMIMDYVYSSDDSSPASTKMDSKWIQNFERNRKLIDLEEIPKDLVAMIKKEYVAQKQRGPVNKQLFLDYLIQHRCRSLIECINDFFVMPLPTKS